MSNHLAIATVTSTLFHILTQGLQDEGAAITTKPPDRARNNGSGDQVNVFLYYSAVNAAWRNMDPPRQVKPGESGHPPLALTLYYLVTAYGSGDEDIPAHRILGRAMSVLHDHPILGRAEFQNLADSDLHEQVERVRITPEPLSLDDMYKLWSSFQTQYRPSAAYQVSVVLIDSERPAKTPLPVLTRGEADSGVDAQADLVPPFPTLTAVAPPIPQPAARLGEEVTLTGHHLGGDTVDVHFRHPRLPDPVVLTPEAGATDTELTVILPTTTPVGSPDWTAGIFSVSAVIHRAGEEDRGTNELPLALAPRITLIDPNPAALDTDDTLTVECEPEAWPEQKPRLLLGDRLIAADTFAAPSGSLGFPLAGATAGEHFVRLRIDGVDSLLIDYTQKPPVFDSNQRVTLVDTI